MLDPETKRPFVLFNAEREFFASAFRVGEDGRLIHPEQVYSAPKKSGKTLLGAVHLLTTTLLFGGRYSEAYCVANDLEQAQGRVFEACRRIVETSPLLRREAKILADRIIFSTIGASIVALASDYASAAGGHPTIAVFDELWGYTSERARRLWDELIPVPTRKISCRLTVTHAGFEGESVLLQELHRRGLTQPLIGTDLYAGDGLLMFWSHAPVAPWQDEKWLSEMRRSLRPNQYLRMIENRFVTTESSFIEMAWWDGCVDVAAKPVVSDRTLPVWIGVDASVKRDSTALCAVTWNSELQHVRLVNHKIVQPSAAMPINFEAVVEGTLLDWHQRYRVEAVLYDPYQMVASAQRLAGYGLPMNEYPHTPANLTEASQNLFELIKGRNLVAYPDEAIRSAITRAVAIETPRGWRIGKEKQTHKIDIVVAMGMAALSAVRTKPKQRIISGAIGVGGDITWYDPDTGLPFDPSKPLRRSYLAHDEHGNTVLVAGAGSNDCNPGYTDALGIFHPAHRSYSRALRGQY